MVACPPVLLTTKMLILTPSSIGQHCINDSWISYHGLLKKTSTMTDLYTGSAYFAIVTFMTVGFGEYYASGFHEV